MDTNDNLTELPPCATEMVPPEWGTIDQMEAMMKAMPAIMPEVFQPMVAPLCHHFTRELGDNFYVRQIKMPARSLLTSKIHRTHHTFQITQGSCLVWTKEEGVKKLTAPYAGVTPPFTRRLIWIITETVWTTFHPTEETDLQAIEDKIIHKNPTQGFILEDDNMQIPDEFRLAIEGGTP